MVVFGFTSGAGHQALRLFRLFTHALRSPRIIPQQTGTRSRSISASVAWSNFSDAAIDSVFLRFICTQCQQFGALRFPICGGHAFGDALRFAQNVFRVSGRAVALRWRVANHRGQQGNGAASGLLANVRVVPRHGRWQRAGRS